ncbi:MAG: hypothetical protein QOE54_1317 [Streptosporangiaceae bacterium]|nr:hypothetical protein [Streptosporangiaceae bacterium]MDX6428951.1 hypothetical protein [Streptosporangiaceae bacterium]
MDATHRVRNDGRVDLPEQQPAPADPSRFRASDADRDRVADQLREALAEGRLSPEEHAERIELVYSAKTYAELAPALEDLPVTVAPSAAPTVAAPQDLPAPPHEPAGIVAIFSGAERKGRWLVEPHTNVFTMFGGVELDFREAVLTQREVTINITCIFGGVDIKVPPGVRVIDSGMAIFGGRSIAGGDPDDPNAPVIRLTGFTLFGGVDVKRRAPKGEQGDFRERLREQRDQIRQRRDERRDHLRELRQARRRDRRER